LTNEILIGTADVGGGRVLELSAAFPHYGDHAPRIYMRLVTPRPDGTRPPGATAWIILCLESLPRVIELLEATAARAAQGETP
jgi:hypothetical protein